MRKEKTNMATKTANILARIEPDIKSQAEEIMNELGVPASVVINMLYKQIIITKSIPFSISLNTRPKAVEELSKAEFDSMMQAGYDDAIADNSEDANVVFARIKKRITEHG